MPVPDKLVLADPGKAADRFPEAPSPPPLPVLLRVPRFRQDRPTLPLPGSPRRRRRTRPVILAAVLVVATAGLLLARWQAWIASISPSGMPAPRTRHEDTQTLPPLGPDQKMSLPRAEGRGAPGADSSTTRHKHPDPGPSSTASFHPAPGTPRDSRKRSLDPAPGPVPRSGRPTGTAPPPARLVPWIEPIDMGGSP
jgi:hypothetical protein